MSDDDRATVEQAIEAAQLRPYQAMVVRNTAAEWSVQAAEDYIEACKEVGDGAATTS